MSLSLNLPVTVANGVCCVFLRRVVGLQWKESSVCAAQTERRCDAVERRSCARGLRTQQLESRRVRGTHTASVHYSNTYLHYNSEFTE